MWPEPPMNVTGTRTSRHSTFAVSFCAAGSATAGDAIDMHNAAASVTPVAIRRTSDRVRFFAESRFVIDLSPFPQWIAQFAAQDLSDRRLGNGIDHVDLLRHLVAGQPATHE